LFVIGSPGGRRRRGKIIVFCIIYLKGYDIEVGANTDISTVFFKDSAL
jgi:hypothetical protein